MKSNFTFEKLHQPRFENSEHIVWQPVAQEKEGWSVLHGIYMRSDCFGLGANACGTGLKGRSLTTLTKFGLLLTTYLPLAVPSEGISLLV